MHIVHITILLKPVFQRQDRFNYNSIIINVMKSKEIENIFVIKIDMYIAKIDK
jgi:hypothetical protein